MNPPTAESSAQSFDYGSFFSNLLNTGVGIVANKISPSQNTGQPSVSTQPNLSATPGQNTRPAGISGALGVSPQTLSYIGIGAALIVGVYLLTKK